MTKAAQFQIISRNIFETDSRRLGFENGIETAYEGIALPRRATYGSAGYDFCTPYALRLAPGESVTVPTGIRARIDEGWFLMIVPRSGLGFKYRLQLDNTAGIIDSDYYYSDNEGHIQVKITNDGRQGKTLELAEGERFAQGIFLPYGITVDDFADGIRNGGMGSTDRK